MNTARDYIDRIAAGGVYHFTTDEACKALGGTAVAVRAALRRLKARGEIADPYRGFHVIVPPEYRRLGCLPPEQFVPQLMERLGEVYYVALLSAAQLHGAAHHRPQRFQVMVARNRKPLSCGEVRVEFVARRDLDRMPVVTLNTPRGTLRVASPESTALELVGYAGRCGGLDNVATVLEVLAERLDPEPLAVAARRCPIAWSQRLGYLLEHTGHEALLAPLAKLVSKEAVFVAPLVRSQSIQGSPRADRWKLAVNASVEADS